MQLVGQAGSHGHLLEVVSDEEVQGSQARGECCRYGNIAIIHICACSPRLSSASLRRLVLGLLFAPMRKTLPAQQLRR